MFRLPEKFVPPFIIEPVTKQSRVRMPYRVTSKIMMNYLSPPSLVREQEESSRSHDSSDSLGLPTSSRRSTFVEPEASVETLPAALAYDLTTRIFR